MSKAATDVAKSAGRGLVSITGAKLYFIIAGYAVQFILPRLLGSREAYGLYSTALTIASMVNNVLIAATVQSVSKLVSEDESRADATLRRALQIQLVLGVVISGLGVALAAPLAHGVLLDDALTPLLRLCCVVVFSYSLYAALVGALNGKRAFQKQAGLDMTFSTLRTGAILGAAALGFGVQGAIAGFASASLGILIVALFVVGLGRSGDAPPAQRWWANMAPLFLYQLFLNGILQVDLPILKGTVAEVARAGGATESIAATLASSYAGCYRAAQSFAFVPYQLILSVTFVVFPLVSKSVSGNDHESTRAYVHNAMRFSLIVLCALAAPMAGASDGVMRLVFPAEYADGATALAILAVGIVAFALFVIAATVLSGAGNPTISAAIAIAATGVVVVANRFLVMSAGANQGAMAAAATGTTAGMFFALVAIGIVTYRRFKTFLPVLTTVRVLIAASAAAASAHYLPHAGKLSTLVALVAGAVVYVVILFASRELGRHELDVIKRLARRKS